ncbi:hypothetical protein PTKIN_Ptkin12aG0106000 [Pterospermum kingtungense]
MYADQVKGAEQRSVKERLNGNSSDNSIRRRQIIGKRFMTPAIRTVTEGLEEEDVGRGKMTSGNMIFTKTMNLKLQVWIA